MGSHRLSTTAFAKNRTFRSSEAFGGALAFVLMRRSPPNMLSRFPVRALVAMLAWAAAAFAAESSRPPDQARLDALRAELEAMHQTDQAQRQQMDQVRREHGQNSAQMRELWAKQNQSDSYNIKRLEEIIAEIGWPKRSEVGERAASAAFLILQHSDLSYQKKYLPLARAAVAANEMRGSSLALLEDRILLREGKNQIYGSQVRQNEAGQWEVPSLEDPENVDKRRALVGLGPLKDYLAVYANRGGTAGDGQGEAPAVDAPALTQTIFEANDTASRAYAKLRAVKPGSGAPGIELQRACRDFCARFPDSPLYVPVRIMAARYWAWLKESDRAELKDWDPGSAEQDPKLNREQQATVAVQMAPVKINRTANAGRWPEARLEAIAALARTYPGSEAVRDELIPAALDVAPEVAVPVLHELYPADPSAIEATKVIEAIGRPFEFQLVTLDGRSLAAADFRGKVTMLLLAVTDATYVDAIATQLKVVAEKHGPEHFAIALVSLSKTPTAATDFLQRNAVDWPTQSDGQGWSTPLLTRMLVRIVPYYLLLDREGRLRYRGLSPSSNEAAKRIEALVAEAPTPEKN